MHRAILMLTGALALSACSAGTSSIPLERPSAPTSSSPRAAPQIMRDSSVSSIVGQNAPALLNRFGTARIDLAEGDARKLQFASATCVLDIFLYPLSANTQAVATHVEARQRPNGGQIDHANCIADIERGSR